MSVPGPVAGRNANQVPIADASSGNGTLRLCAAEDSPIRAKFGFEEKDVLCPDFPIPILAKILSVRMSEQPAFLRLHTRKALERPKRGMRAFVT